MSMTSAINAYKKTPYTQFFCNENKGMKLRSGTVINCIKNTPLYQDIADLYENMPLQPLHEGEDGVYEFSTWLSSDCSSVINQLRFIERHHDTLQNNACLIGIYRETLETLRSWILGIKSGGMKCNCWQYHSWHVTEGACMLTPEYEYLSSLDRTEYYTSIENKKNKPEHSSFYQTRHLRRLFHNNFLVPTEDLDTDGIPVKKHDYNLILEELKIWERYFRRQHSTERKASSVFLKTITIDDCAGRILEFL